MNPLNGMWLDDKHYEGLNSTFDIACSHFAYGVLPRYRYALFMNKIIKNRIYHNLRTDDIYVIVRFLLRFTSSALIFI